MKDLNVLHLFSIHSDFYIYTSIVDLYPTNIRYSCFLGEGGGGSPGGDIYLLLTENYW